MDLQFLIQILTFFTFSLFFLFKFVPKANKGKLKLPPGPPKLPLIGSILSVASTKVPHRIFSDLSKKYGPLLHLQLGEISAVIVSSPRLAKEVLKTHGLTFADRPNLLVSKIVAYDFTDIAFTPYGSYWRQMRKICTLDLLSAKKVREFRYIREDEVLKLVESVRSSSLSTINLTERIYKLSNVVTCRAVFGEGCKDQDTLIKIIQDLMIFAGGLHAADLFPSWKFLPVLTGMKPKLLKLRRKVDEMLDEAIKEHKEKQMLRGNARRSEDEDLLDVFLRIQEEGGLEFPITCDNIKAVILEMFGAGTDTSSAVTEWAISELIRNPRVMHKAQNEVRQALKGKKIVSEMDIQGQGLSYLKLVIKETLRLHPPLPLLVPRECRDSCEIDGYNIPIKTKLIVNAWALGRDPEYWHDDAEIFKPERFENSCVEYIGANFEYIPFGAGKRICPGIAFGVANVELPLAQLLYHFDWKLPGNMKPEDLDMSEAFGAAAKRKNSLFLIPTPHG